MNSESFYAEDRIAISEPCKDTSCDESRTQDAAEAGRDDDESKENMGYPVRTA
jgi:hypothetical protein